MKYMYVCEKCGKQFDDYSAAQACEESHLMIDNCYHKYSQEMAKLSVWGKGDRMPRQAVFATPIDYNNGDNEDDGDCFFGVYEFKRLLCHEEVQQIVTDHKVRMEKENRLIEEFERERRAAKTPESINKIDAME